MSKRNTLVSLGFAGFISSVFVIFFHFAEPPFISMGVILFVLSALLLFGAIWGNPSTNLNISIPAVLTGILIYPAMIFSFQNADSITLGIIIALLTPILFSFLSGYIAKGDVSISQKLCISAIKSSGTYPITAYTTVLVLWLKSCAFLDERDYSCGTGAEKLMIFVFIYPLVTIVAPIVGVCVAFFTRLGFKMHTKTQKI